jgi:hypothetical protein
LKLFLGTPLSGAADDGSVGEAGVESQPTRPVTTTAPPRSPTRVNLPQNVLNSIPFPVIAGVQEQRTTRSKLHPPSTTLRTSRFFSGSTRRVSPPNGDLITGVPARERHLSVASVMSSTGPRHRGSPEHSGRFMRGTIPRDDQNPAAVENDLTRDTLARRTNSAGSACARRTGDFS